MCKEVENRLGSIGDSLEVMSHPWFKDFNWSNLMSQKIEPLYKPLKPNSDWEEGFDPEFIKFKPNDSISRDDCLHLEKYKKDFEIFEY